MPENNTDVDTNSPDGTDSSGIPPVANDIDTSKGIIAWFAENHVAANLLMILIIAVGLLSLTQIKRELQPDMTIDVVEVNIAYPGASPTEVESGLTSKIEDVVKDINGVEEYRSYSREGGLMMYIDVLNGFDVSDVLSDVKNRIDGITNLPQESEKALVSQVVARYPALQVQVHGQIDEKTLNTVMRNMRKEMLQEDNISSIEIYGLRDYEISVEVGEEQLKKHQLTLRDVATAINNSSLDIAGGSIRSKSGNILLRTKGQAFNQKAFEQIVLKTFPDGTRLLLGDIALVRDEFTQGSGMTLFDNEYGAGMLVYAIGEQDLITTADAAKAYIAKKRLSLPPNVKVSEWLDISYYLNGRLELMLGNLAMGAALVFLVLTIFLNFKLAFWVMAGLPVCFLGTIALLPMGGINVTLNMMSLFGFIMVLGIMVDDAIIIGESIDSSTRHNGNTLDNVIRGAKMVALPATFGVLTTVVAFIPTVSLSGVFAPMPAAFGWVVIFCLLFSLVESKLILPAHIAHSNIHRWPLIGSIGAVCDRLSSHVNVRLEEFIQHKYLPFLRTCIAARYSTLASFVAGLMVTGGIVASGVVVLSIMPTLPSDFLSARVEMIEGTPDQQTFDAILQMNSALYETEKEYQQQTGEEENFILHASAWALGGKEGEFTVELTKNEARSIDSFEIVERWREKTGAVAGSKNLHFSSTDDSFGDPISLNLVATDTDTIEKAARELAAIVSTYEGVYGVKTTLSNRVDELNLSIKPGAEALGLNLRDLGTQVRDAYYGVEAQRIQRGEEEVKVMVRYPRDDRRSLADLDGMHVRTADNMEIPFHAVADISTQKGYSAINRIDGKRTINVSGNVDKQNYNPDNIVSEIMEKEIPGLLEKYPGLSVGLDGQAKESMHILVSLFKGLALALIGVYSLLAIPLRSYTQPLIIMSVIPFSIIGAIVGHILFDMSFSMMSFFGVIALTGVVVNDSLILIHAINRRIDQGIELTESIVAACKTRFRPIMLTSATTFFGLFPMLLETSLQAQDMVPMGVSLAFGIVFATLLTLLLVPCLFLILADIGALKTGAAAESVPANS